MNAANAEIYSRLGINGDLAGYILNWRYQLKFTGIPKRKWRAIIGKHFVESGKSKQFGTDAFCSTWDGLEKIGLIE